MSRLPVTLLACLSLTSALALSVLATAAVEVQTAPQTNLQSNSNSSLVELDTIYQTPAQQLAGQEGLDAMAKKRDQMAVMLASIKQPSVDPAPVSQITANIKHLNLAMDAFSNQRYGHISRLYWYTDLAAAKAQAQKTHRPILSLRMLGNLTDEYSCANSRFFRVMLYADPTINNYLRENFVLHWQSVRDVPQVTVTLADGSTMRRTVTGNSVHMVLTEDGQIVDVIPGLWHPAAFLKQVQTGKSLATQMQQVARKAGESDLARNLQLAVIREFHQRQKAATQLAFSERLKALDIKSAELQTRNQSLAVRVNNLLTARLNAEVAMPMAVTKSFGEAPLMQPIRLVNVQTMWQQINLPKWQMFADSFKDEAKLSDAAWSLIAAENNGDAEPFRQTLTDSLASDTAFNQFFLKQQIHDLFATSNINLLTNDAALTQKLYREVLGMDLSDNWAGLSDAKVYTGLSQGGMVSESFGNNINNTQAQLITD